MKIITEIIFLIVWSIVVYSFAIDRCNESHKIDDKLLKLEREMNR